MLHVLNSPKAELHCKAVLSTLFTSRHTQNFLILVRYTGVMFIIVSSLTASWGLWLPRGPRELFLGLPAIVPSASVLGV